MQIENKFFVSFFYPFLICIIISTLVLIIILVSFTNNKLDERTRKKIINLEKNNSKMIINPANAIISTKFLKFQSGLNELILSYQKAAKELLLSNTNQELNTNFLKCVLTLDYYFCDDYFEEAENYAFWLLDTETSEYNLDEKIDVKQQLIAYSNIIQNLNSVFESTKPNGYSYFFYFETSELYISFPMSTECEYYFIYYLIEPLYELTLFQCLDEEGKYYPLYKFKCEAPFKNMMKSKTGTFDYNFLSNINKTIFIINFYTSIEYDFDLLADRKFTMCIEFDDPITKGKGYACVDASYTDIIFPLDELNSKISGYFFISNVGYNNLFYYPQGTSALKSSTETIYKWGLNYKLSEKIYFHENIRKILSSNYLDFINAGYVYDEIFVNGKNNSIQFFSLNNEKFRYSIFPLILENLNGKKEHIMSLIYIYNDELLLHKIDIYNTTLSIKVILVLFIITVFVSYLLFLIYLTFNTLVKYIVIPIKNVNYMLKGINIGGNKRIEYLKYLKKKQDENIEKLEKSFLFNKKDNKEKNNNSIENNYQDNEDLINKEGKKEKYSSIKNINKYSDKNKKYDKENKYLENEYNFYDFDEYLLQYRPIEIENIIKSLFDLKSAMNLTSFDRGKEQIIKYCYSEKIFKNFKNKEGAIICQSNIGNLQSQLFEFDKAIYHLALSLQDNKLIKFLNSNINDELDEDDFLFNKISNSYNDSKKMEKNNKLLQKQMHNSKNIFSKKLIGILINTRYPKLIYSYFMFFKKMQKHLKINSHIINGQFMNTKFHTINYFHKILIQFIYLSYTKNDLVKIGESILNYIQFLIKFKFKTISGDKYFLKIQNKNRPEFTEKINHKKKIFDKIINYFNLFDNYIAYVKENSSLNDSKDIINTLSQSLYSENKEFNLESQTVFLFRVNIQKINYLKAKFSLYCKNYEDALFFFIKSAKKISIINDGLIKKKSLKHIYKLLIKMQKKYKKFGINNLNMNKELKKYKRDKNEIKNKKIINRAEKSKITFSESIDIIKRKIILDINEYNVKQDKDIIILIDFNIYNKKEENLIKTYKIDTFIEETILILNDYLSSTDRLSVVIYSNNYQIICPLMNVNKIDNEIFSKDLIYYKNKILNSNKDNEIEELKDDIEFDFDRNMSSDHSEEDSFDINENKDKIYIKIHGLIQSINFINNYLKMKDEVKNEKYFIIFTDMINSPFYDAKQIKNIFENLIGDKFITFLLVGKNKESKLKGDSINFIGNNKNLEKLILDKYGKKSEIILFENIKIIKTILSNNKVIKDNVFYPNEIYK